MGDKLAWCAVDYPVARRANKNEPKVPWRVKMARQMGYHESNGCPVEATLDALGGKWKGMLVYLLMNGPMRYSSLRPLLPGISERTLTKQLRELEAAGLIARDLSEGSPLAVHYRLTEFGETLRPVVLAMETWGLSYLARPRQVPEKPLSPQEAIVIRRRTGRLPG
jgi:DNA-binding HxlR family transcriptional regulator